MQQRRAFAVFIICCWFLVGGCGFRQTTPAPPAATPVRPPSARTPTAGGVSPSQSPPSASEASPPLVDNSFVMSDPSLERVILNAINDDRQANGLSPLGWDAVAAQAGALHAADMAAQGYFSHWSPGGYGPEYRYNLAGGRDTAAENIYTFSYRFDGGRAAPIDDFAAVVREAEVSLMQSPGHRANILTPEHTHVGVGFAYNPQTGSFYLVQEFVNRYVEMEPLPLRAALDTTLLVQGRLLEGASSPNVNLTYQPFPQPLSLDALSQTGAYLRDAEIYQAVLTQVGADGTFQAQAVLSNQGLAGVYSVRVWVTVDGKEVLASEWLVEVQ